MLFSEPKIPQFNEPTQTPRLTRGFSALQRAENSSIGFKRSTVLGAANVSVLFSEPKIPQFTHLTGLVGRYNRFQCSSASRKFLNRTATQPRAAGASGFSALQRAENSSICQAGNSPDFPRNVSVLFSEPKIPQSISCAKHASYQQFSFSALQRAENSSIELRDVVVELVVRVSVLFSEPKIPQSNVGSGGGR